MHDRCRAIFAAFDRRAIVSVPGGKRKGDEARHETIPCLCSASPFITDESRSPDERGTSKAKKIGLAPAAGYKECEHLSPLGPNGFIHRAVFTKL